MANHPDGSIIIDTKLDSTGFESGLKKIGSLAAKGTAALAAAIGTAGGVALKVGSDFEAAMSKVKATAGASTEQFAALTAKAQEMGAATKFTASQSAEALNYMAMAGWDTEQMLSGISGVMDLAAASGENLGRVSDIVTDALTAFGLKASDSAHFADVLAKASASSNTNVSMMGQTFKYVAPLAGTLGYSIEDTATAIGIMANAGIKGEQAGTSLRSMFTRLADPPKDAAEAMDTLGISLSDASGNMLPLSEVIDRMRESFAGLSQQEQASAASAIAGTEAMSGLLAIVNASQSDYDKLTEAIANADGAAAEMAETMQDNLQGQMTILGSSLEGLGIKVYDKFAEPLKEAVKGAIKDVNDLTKSVSDGKLSSSVDKIAKSFADLTEDLAEGVTKVLPKVIDALVWLMEHGKEVAAAVASITAAVIAFKMASEFTKIAKGWNLVSSSLDKAAKGQKALMLGQGALIGAMALAQVAIRLLTGKITIATAKQWLWNVAMSANPLGLLVAAVAAVAAGIGVLILAQQNEKSELDEMTEKINEQRKAWYELKVAAADKRRSDLADVENTKSQWEELKTLIDEYGNLIGKKERAKVLIDEINKVMPNSIYWLGEEKIGYDNSATAIDNLIKKKQAQVILDSEEETYRKALIGIREKESEQTLLGLTIKERESNLQELETQRLRALGEGNQGLAIDIAYRMQVEKESLNDSLKIYGENEDLLKTYYSQKSGYEELSAAITTNNYSKISKTLSNYGSDMKRATGATKEELARQVATTGEHLLQMETRFAQGYAGVTGETVRQAQKEFVSAAREYEKAGGTLADGIIDGWIAREPSLLALVKGTVHKIDNELKIAGEIHSPSRLLAREIGGPLAAGIGVGFEREIPDVYSKMRAAVDAQTASLSAGTTIQARAMASTQSTRVSSSPAPSPIIHNYHIDEISIPAEDIQSMQDVIRIMQNQLQSRRKGYTGE